MELAGEISNREQPAQLEYFGFKMHPTSLIAFGGVSDPLLLIHIHKLWIRFLQSQEAVNFSRAEAQEKSYSCA